MDMPHAVAFVQPQWLLRLLRCILDFPRRLSASIASDSIMTLQFAGAMMTVKRTFVHIEDRHHAFAVFIVHMWQDGDHRMPSRLRSKSSPPAMQAFVC